MFEPTFDIEGLPELNARLDKIAAMVSGPIAREALEAAGAIIKNKAVANVRKLTGALAEDIIVVTRMREEGLEKYVLIGPGWEPNAYRRVSNRQVGNRAVASADSTTNPGVYGYFLEVGHRAPGQGLTHNLQFKRDQSAARKQGKRVDTSKYGNSSTPAYPWLGPAVESERDAALQAAADVIETRLSEQGF
jgi:hypothetical protein